LEGYFFNSAGQFVTNCSHRQVAGMARTGRHGLFNSPTVRIERGHTECSGLRQNSMHSPEYRGTLCLLKLGNA
jgi:hypothetical protein